MKIKLILKGVLFYFTFALSVLAMAGIDSICDNGFFIETIITIVCLIYLCRKTISEEEFDILSLDNLFNKHKK